jgi:alcohol dehydrogenase class IV
MYKLPHGHAVAICLPEVWNYMNSHMEECIDERGPDYLRGVFSDIADTLECADAKSTVVWFRDFLTELEMNYPMAGNRDAELEVLTASVNSVRLKNNPVVLDSTALRGLYERILK